MADDGGRGEQGEAEVGVVDGALFGAPLGHAVFVGGRRGFGDGGGDAAKALVFVERFFVEQRGVGVERLHEEDRGVGGAANGGGAAGVGEGEAAAGGLLDQGEGEAVLGGAALAEPQGLGAEHSVEGVAGVVGEQRVLARGGGEAAFGHAGDEQGVETEGADCAGSVADQHALKGFTRSEAGFGESAEGGAPEAFGGVARADALDAGEGGDGGADRVDQAAVLIALVVAAIARRAAAVVDVIGDGVEDRFDCVGPVLSLSDRLGAFMEVVADIEQFAGGFLLVGAVRVFALECFDAAFEVGVEFVPITGQAGVAGDALPLEGFGGRIAGQASAEGGIAEELEQSGALGLVAEEFDQVPRGASGVGVEDGLSAGDEDGRAGALDGVGESGVGGCAAAVEDGHLVESDAFFRGVKHATCGFRCFGSGIGGGEALDIGGGWLRRPGFPLLGVGFFGEGVGKIAGVLVALGSRQQHADLDRFGATSEESALHAGEVVHAGDDQRTAAECCGDVLIAHLRGEGVLVERGAVAQFGDALAPGGVERGEVKDDAAVVGVGRSRFGEAGEVLGGDAAFAEVGEGDGERFGESGGIGLELLEAVGCGELVDEVAEQQGGCAGGERGALFGIGAVGDFACEVGGGEEVEGGEWSDFAGEAALVVEALESGADEDVDAGERSPGAVGLDGFGEAAFGGGEVGAALDGWGHGGSVARGWGCGGRGGGWGGRPPSPLRGQPPCVGGRFSERRTAPWVRGRFSGGADSLAA